jgi:hypothetical protein
VKNNVSMSFYREKRSAECVVLHQALRTAFFRVMQLSRRFAYQPWTVADIRNHGQRKDNTRFADFASLVCCSVAALLRLCCGSVAGVARSEIARKNYA